MYISKEICIQAVGIQNTITQMGHKPRRVV